MRNIRFDPVEGKYWDGAREVPRVSRILEETGHGFRGPRGSDWHKEKGTLVHRATALYDAGTLDWDSLDATIRPYVEAWKKFKSDTGCKCIAVETILYSEDLDYAGTADRVCVLPKVSGREMILDIKSGGKTKDHRLQLGAYTAAWADAALPRVSSANVYLKPSGKYSLTLFSPEETAANVADWLAVLAEYRRQEEDLWS